MRQSRVWIRQAYLVAVNELRIFVSDPAGQIVLVVMPPIMMVFLGSGFEALFRNIDQTGFMGSAHVVAGMCSLFSMLFAGNVSVMFFREHGWNTWYRLRISVLADGSIVAGKIVVLVLLCTTQVWMTFCIGSVLLGLSLDGLYLQILAINVVHSVTVVSIGLFLTAICRTVMQATAIAQVSAIMMGGLGGAFSPTNLLPEWVQHIAMLSPSYWMIDAYKELFSFGRIAVSNILILLGIAIVGFCFFFARLDFKEDKVYWS